MATHEQIAAIMETHEALTRARHALDDLLDIAPDDEPARSARHHVEAAFSDLDRMDWPARDAD